VVSVCRLETNTHRTRIQPEIYLNTCRAFMEETMPVDASKGLCDLKKAPSSREFVVDRREREEPIPNCNSRFETS
jgi:hypothetical protein